jgi:hypothetical protein
MPNLGLITDPTMILDSYRQILVWHLPNILIVLVSKVGIGSWSD